MTEPILNMNNPEWDEVLKSERFETGTIYDGWGMHNTKGFAVEVGFKETYNSKERKTVVQPKLFLAMEHPDAGKKALVSLEVRDFQRLLFSGASYSSVLQARLYYDPVLLDGNYILTIYNECFKYFRDILYIKAEDAGLLKAVGFLKDKPPLLKNT